MPITYLGRMMVCIPAIQINITREQIILLLKAKSLVDWYCQIESKS